MNILEKFLKHVGVSSFTELNSEEKETYKEWESALSGRTITEQDYRTFLEAELEVATSRLTEVNLSKEDEIFRKVEVRMVKNILKFLDGPLIEKALLEKQIESRL